MGSIAEKLTIFSFLTVLAAVITGCSPHTFVQGEPLIMLTKSLTAYAGQREMVIVGTRTADEYSTGHVAGTVNTPTEDIVIDVSVESMLASKKKIKRVMRKNGVSSDTLVLTCDSDKMDVSRSLQSLSMYRHQNVKAIDGGFNVIQGAGILMTTDISVPESTVFTAREPLRSWLVDMDDVGKQAEQSDSHMILLDVRTQEGFVEKGKVPGSVIIPYEANLFSDGTFKTIQITRINYLEGKIYPEDEIIIRCQTSMWATPAFVQFYETGYRNTCICSGVYLGWSPSNDSPMEIPAGGAAPVKKNASQDLGYMVNSNE